MSLNYTASISGELWTCDVLPERVDLTPAHTVWLGGPGELRRVCEQLHSYLTPIPVGPSPSPFKQRKQASMIRSMDAMAALAYGSHFNKCIISPCTLM
jgi:hypothetical protein